MTDFNFPETASEADFAFGWDEGIVSSEVPGPEVAAERAKRYDFALGGDSPGRDNLYRTIVSGQEDQERQRVATRDALNDEKARTAVIQDLLRQGELTPERRDVVRNLSAAELRSPDINTILEKKFAEKLTSSALAVSPIMASAMESAKYNFTDKAWEQVDIATRNITIQQS
jgi:hypothetical protein